MSENTSFTLSILGSTGSIGTQALEILAANRERFHLHSLSANRSWELLARQVREFEPDYAVLCDPSHADEFKNAVGSTRTTLMVGRQAMVDLVDDAAVDTVLNALVGFSGFLPTYKALENGKRVALANKESLVTGGELVMELARRENAELHPVDSEHSAIFQCLTGEGIPEVEKLVLTASGGPFRTWAKEDMAKITVEQALKHPNWSMGAKITIDSATMMNKGLEVIEAYWLFGLPLNKIDVVVHPQSIIHSMVTFVDGSSKAQLGPPDMMVPIQYALSYPARWPSEFPRMDWTELQKLTFEPVDHARFPSLGLARDAITAGGYAPTVLNAANEVAVDRFLKREIAYIDICNIVGECLQSIEFSQPLSETNIIEVDAETRRFARSVQA